MVLGYCIVHNVLLFLRSREWQVLVRIFSRRRRFRAGFSSLLGVLEVGSLLRMLSNALVVIHIYALGQTVMGAPTRETLTGLQGCHGYLEIRHPVF